MTSSMCESRKLSVHEWDTVLDECTLAYNNTVNQSSGFSPAKKLFGKATRLPIDNIMQLNTKWESVDADLVRKNAKLN